VYREVIRFWFEEIDPSRWWAKDTDLDRLIAQRFAAIHAQATRCELFGWRAGPEGRLAEIIVLDQFSRNLFRGRPESFASDSLALALAQEAVVTGADRSLPPTIRDFLYMPYMHSESLLIHDSASALFESNAVANTIDFARRHRAVIARFGRYPHRNAILGRQSTAEEIEFLAQPGSSF
jgi:uncharacterized protein (DUF924 family)